MEGLVMKKKRNDHEGHRRRVRRKYIEHSMDVFLEHEALELYLFYAIPRKDTNEMAHRLLDRYVTLAAVCNAPIDELERDFGLSETAAVLLKILPDMCRLYTQSALSMKNSIELETVGELMAANFIGRTYEAVSILLGDAKGRILYNGIISKGSFNQALVSKRRIIDIALRHNAKTIFIAHNHPGGSELPSGNDIRTTNSLSRLLGELGVQLLDHFIVANNIPLSIRRMGVCECFDYNEYY